MLSKELVIRQLEADSHYRRLKWCPLVSLEKARALRAKFYPGSQETRYNYHHQATDLAIVPTETIIHAMKNFESVVAGIKISFPATTKILEQFEGEVILAGGCLARTIVSPYSDGVVSSSDADFFFIGCSKDRILLILDEVEKVLRSQLDEGGSLRRVTSLRTTTFYESKLSEHLSSSCVKYQFIHSRSYPSEEAVILGFDIPAGSVFYDGTDILMTPMAAFTFACSVIFLDPSRRSTTYEKRLLKYSADMWFALGTIATTNERIKQAYVGDRPLGARHIKHDFVRGIEIEIQEFGKTFISRNVVAMQRDDVFGDYGAEAINEYMIKLHNGFFSLHGQVENIAWIKSKQNQEFTEPPVKYPKALYPRPSHPLDHSPDIVFLRHAIGPLISAEEAVKVIGPIDKHYLDRAQMNQVAEYLLPKAALIVAQATERLRVNDLEYIGPNDNPGRQHTSSFNPVYGDVRDYWFYRFYDVTIIGLPNNVYLSLKCVLGRHGIYEKGVLKIICNHVMTARSLDSLASLMEGVTIRGEGFRRFARQYKLGEDGSISPNEIVDISIDLEQDEKLHPLENEDEDIPDPIGISQDELDARAEEKRM